MCGERLLVDLSGGDNGIGWEGSANTSCDVAIHTFYADVSWTRSEAAMIHRSGSEVTATFVVLWSVLGGFRAPSIEVFALAPFTSSIANDESVAVAKRIAKPKPTAAIIFGPQFCVFYHGLCGTVFGQRR